MMEQPLPAGFEDLRHYLDWALPTTSQRHAKRLAATREELKNFYEAALAKIEDILAEVDRWPLGELPESHRPLYDIALSLVEVAPHIELYSGAPGVPYAFEEARFIARHADHETWRGRNPVVVT